MIAKKFLDLTSKGKEWFYADSTSGNDSATALYGGGANDPPTYWNYATDSIHQAAQSSYSSWSNMVSSFYSFPSPEEMEKSSTTTTTTSPEADTSSLQQIRRGYRRLSGVGFGSLLHNPYNTVRGRHPTEYHTNMSAVRSLLSIVPIENQDDNLRFSVSSRHLKEAGRSDDNEEDEDTMTEDLDAGWSLSFAKSSQKQGENSKKSPRRHSSSSLDKSMDHNSYHAKGKAGMSPTEIASQLAEGTLRALRGLALDEAVELNQALRYWNSRWERPLLSWLEAGPTVWFSRQGYNQQLVGLKVSQIQAVLVRRCAAIGEMQQHLLRAGWQRGVAQWGFLGQDGQWGAVAGCDGKFFEKESPEAYLNKASSDDPLCGIRADKKTYQPRSTIAFEDIYLPRQPLMSSPAIAADRPRRFSPYKASVIVQKTPGGGIFIDDPSRLAEWSIEAMALVRRHLYRSANGLIVLPYQSNWEDGAIPIWASEVFNTVPEDTEASEADVKKGRQLIISNLPLFVAEVEELLNVMEEIMEIQRRRRLYKMQPPSWMRRSWYLFATSLPIGGVLTVWLIRKGHGKALLRSLSHSVSSFYNEHLRLPLVAIANELWKGRESFSDKKARAEAMATLKKMIRAWLDDFYPDMAEDERNRMAEAMDVSLVELKKEESMKTFYEINNVIRMSFIEMQYMKKEMMNALHAMDEMMSSNDMNMNVAAITPVVILAYTWSRVFRFFFYALLQLGTSREETYASFRKHLIDVERLLVMRDNPPLPSLSDYDADHEEVSQPTGYQSCKLGPDDLGMLMLLVHECRTIMWQNHRRFSNDIVESVSEDLAELIGERGAVSIQQQLHIINRMCRTYPFLKVY